MTQFDAVTQTTLIPGSIWSRTTKSGKEISVTVLFITNLTISPEAQKVCPPQAVFLTQDKEVQSMPVDMFVAKRRYSTMDPQSETLVKALMAADLEDGDDEEIDIDAIPLPEELRNDATPKDLVAEALMAPHQHIPGQAVLTGEANTGSGASFQIAPDHPLATLLSHSFVSYSESADRINAGDTLIDLRFSLSSGLTLEQLRATFGVGSDLEIDTFNVRSTVENTKVNIDTFISVFLEVNHGQPIGMVSIISDGNIRDQQTPLALGSDASEAASTTDGFTSAVVNDLPADSNVIVDLGAVPDMAAVPGVVEGSFPQVTAAHAPPPISVVTAAPASVASPSTLVQV